MITICYCMVDLADTLYAIGVCRPLVFLSCFFPFHVISKSNKNARITYIMYVQSVAVVCHILNCFADIFHDLKSYWMPATVHALLVNEISLPQWFVRKYLSFHTVSTSKSCSLHLPEQRTKQKRGQTKVWQIKWRKRTMWRKKVIRMKWHHTSTCM